MTRRKHSCCHPLHAGIKSLLQDPRQISKKREGLKILRKLRGGALSYLLSSLLQASFGQTGEPSVAFRGDVRVKDSRWERQQTELCVNRSVTILVLHFIQSLIITHTDR